MLKFTPTIDFEVTNKCNAKCYFCPRDATPHEGLMTEEVFVQALKRTIELRDAMQDMLDGPMRVSLCGLGEPLLNKKVVSFAQRVKAEGFRCQLSSNGAPMTEKVAEQIIEAGVDEVYFNVSDIDEEYEEVYKIPFKRTVENVTRFNEMAGDRVHTHIVLVDHRKDPAHIAAMEEYWRAKGFKRFLSYGIINRGGALNVDSMQYEQYKEIAIAREMFAEKKAKPICGAPWGYMFIGYDGNYYLCCSDWRKQGNLGSIFDQDFLDINQKKMRMVSTRDPVCKTCNHDPINRMAEELRALQAGEVSQNDVDKLFAALDKDNAFVETVVGAFDGLHAPEPIVKAS